MPKVPNKIKVNGRLYVRAEPPKRIRVNGNVYKRLEEEDIRTALLRGKKPPVDQHNYPELEQGFLKVSEAIGGLATKTKRELTTGHGREEAALVYIEGKLLNAQDNMMMAYEAILGL